MLIREVREKQRKHEPERNTSLIRVNTHYKTVESWKRRNWNCRKIHGNRQDSFRYCFSLGHCRYSERATQRYYNWRMFSDRWMSIDPICLAIGWRCKSFVIRIYLIWVDFFFSRRFSWFKSIWTPFNEQYFELFSSILFTLIMKQLKRSAIKIHADKNSKKIEKRICLRLHSLGYAVKIRIRDDLMVFRIVERDQTFNVTKNDDDKTMTSHASIITPHLHILPARALIQLKHRNPWNLPHLGISEFGNHEQCAIDDNGW